jgi:hypothetical protein
MSGKERCPKNGLEAEIQYTARKKVNLMNKIAEIFWLIPFEAV